jgi:hypothetical protein
MFIFYLYIISIDYNDFCVCKNDLNLCYTDCDFQ